MKRVMLSMPPVLLAKRYSARLVSRVSRLAESSGITEAVEGVVDFVSLDAVAVGEATAAVAGRD
jgi:hypothetical protein